MPRISNVSGIAALGTSEAIEWIIGDTEEIETTWLSDSAPLDLTGATVGITLEFYFATVSEGGRAGNGNGNGRPVSISALRVDTTRAPVRIAGTVDADQAATPGRFTWRIPADVYAGSQPAADEVANAAMAIAYAELARGAEVRQSRTIVVFRRGKP